MLGSTDVLPRRRLPARYPCGLSPASTSASRVGVTSGMMVGARARDHWLLVHSRIGPWYRPPQYQSRSATPYECTMAGIPGRADDRVLREGLSVRADPCSAGNALSALTRR